MIISCILSQCSLVNGEYANLHFNFKENGILLPETKGDLTAAPEEIYVEAEYTEIGGLRVNKQSVQVGKWVLSSREMDFNFTIEYFNFWYYIVQEPFQDADPEYFFDFNLNGNLLIDGTSNSFDPDNEQVREHVWNMELDTIFVSYYDLIEIYFNYSGYEDLVVYIDNATYDTGIQGNTNILFPLGISAKSNKISIEIYDIFNSNWNEVKSFIDVNINSTLFSIDSIEIEEKNNVHLNNTHVNTTIINWNLNNSFIGGEEVKIWIKFTFAQPGEEKGIIIETYGQSGDGEDENNGLISGFELIILILSIFFSIVIKRNR